LPPARSARTRPPGPKRGRKLRPLQRSSAPSRRSGAASPAAQRRRGADAKRAGYIRNLPNGPLWPPRKGRVGGLCHDFPGRGPYHPRLRMPSNAGVSRGAIPAARTTARRLPERRRDPGHPHGCLERGFRLRSCPRSGRIPIETGLGIAAQPIAPRAGGNEMNTQRRTYNKPRLNRLGLLRALTRFSF
jgi:hypothetical protein